MKPYICISGEVENEIHWDGSCCEQIYFMLFMSLCEDSLESLYFPRDCALFRSRCDLRAYLVTVVVNYVAKFY